MKEKYLASGCVLELYVGSLSREEIEYVNKWLMRKYSRLKYFWRAYYAVFPPRLPKSLERRI